MFMMIIGENVVFLNINILYNFIAILLESP